MRRPAARAAWLSGALLGLIAPLAAHAAAAPRAPVLDPFFDDLEKRTFAFFWDTANPANGLVPDRAPGPSWASIAGVGFALTAYPIGVERGYVTRAAARERTLATLRFFASLTNQHGFFYHFIDMKTGERRDLSEISTVDTTLLLGGILVCGAYFDGKDPAETEIRQLSQAIYRRVDWTWAQSRPPGIVMGWRPETGFLKANWVGYDEGMLIYILALGSPSHPVAPDAWAAWTRTYDKHFGTLYGETHLSFAPLFGHQYSHVWVDFRGIADAYMRAHGLDYFENSRRATYAQQRYAIANPMHWAGYGARVWGLTACEGPGRTRAAYHGESRRFYGYAARGVGLDGSLDDGTIAPTAALGSLPFAPEIVIPAALEMQRRFGAALYSKYGFRDAFNVSVPTADAERTQRGWFDERYLAIDQGPILVMLENYRSDLVWRIMRGNEYIRRGLERAGFQGGWLQNQP
ncbi:MAG TPA: glucoamylase family protein [Steroidobacteraceae bacterium]|nr:glucoamylase family protein [Steroidobacteraceae bacterium]